jgi:hypothetical protein
VSRYARISHLHEDWGNAGLKLLTAQHRMIFLPCGHITGARIDRVDGEFAGLSSLVQFNLVSDDAVRRLPLVEQPGLVGHGMIGVGRRNLPFLYWKVGIEGDLYLARDVVVR